MNKHENHQAFYNASGNWCRRLWEIRQVATEGAREVARTILFYNLDVIISLGYRVHSGIATQFRIWATERLKEYLFKGFTMDDVRLKNLDGGSYWKELLDRIRDIRSSEKVLYRQVLDLYATMPVSCSGVSGKCESRAAQDQREGQVMSRIDELIAELCPDG